MEIETLGIDFAKNVFQLHGVDRRGHAIYKRRIFRDQLLSVVGGIPRGTVVIEA
jgi:transposase